MDCTAFPGLNTVTTASLVSGYRALVLGGGGAIGAALVQAVQADARCAQVASVSRRDDARLDWRQPDLASVALAEWAAQGPWDVVIDATGALTVDGRGPDKRLAELTPEALTALWQINAMGPALAMRALMPALAKGRRVVYAKLSARVGSIEDNHKGGWMAYRSAKAALNQMLQTAAIELARQRPLAVVAALQPGTVASDLSAPFVAAHQALSPQASAAGLWAALDALPTTGRAHFVDYRGQAIPW